MRISTSMFRCPHWLVHEIDTLIQKVSLAIGKMAKFLKIEKANQRSHARFRSQHYGLNAPSTPAKSLLSDSRMSGLKIDPSNIKDLIKSSCRRIDIIINADLGIFTLELIEGAMHYKYEPKYESFTSQK